MFPSFPALDSLTAGGGLSAASSASNGPFRGGEVGGQTFSFGGINTGTQGTPWLTAALIAAGGILAIMLIRR